MDGLRFGGLGVVVDMVGGVCMLVIQLLGEFWDLDFRAIGAALGTG